MLHQISLHRLPDCCTGCNATSRLPRRFRSSARCRACGAGRLAIDPLGPFGAVGTLLVTSLDAGVDTSVIALWLGHAGVRSTDAYVHADISIKERALALTTPAGAKPGRYRPTDKMLAFLEDL